MISSAPLVSNGNHFVALPAFPPRLGLKQWSQRAVLFGATGSYSLGKNQTQFLLETLDKTLAYLKSQDFRDARKVYLEKGKLKIGEQEASKAFETQVLRELLVDPLATSTDPSFSSSFTTAIWHATSLYAGEMRNLPPPYPVNVHTLGVTRRVVAANGSIPEIVAALYHDALEDKEEAILQAGFTEHNFNDVFGGKPWSIIQECTHLPMPLEAYRTREQKLRVWLLKRAYKMLAVQHMSDSAKLVILADKLDNMEDLLEKKPELVLKKRRRDKINKESHQAAELFWEKTSRGAKAGTLWYNESMYQQLKTYPPVSRKAIQVGYHQMLTALDATLKQLRSYGIKTEKSGEWGLNNRIEKLVGKVQRYMQKYAAKKPEKAAVNPWMSQYEAVKGLHPLWYNPLSTH